MKILSHRIREKIIKTNIGRKFFRRKKRDDRLDLTALGNFTFAMLSLLGMVIFFNNVILASIFFILTFVFFAYILIEIFD